MQWEKLGRDRRLAYVPSPRVQSATQRQLDYIMALSYEKGQNRPRLPKTKQGASDLIERLLELPDVNDPQPIETPIHKPLPAAQNRNDVVTELRERFPALSPLTANSMVQLFSQIDEIGMYFIIDQILNEPAPEDTNELILHIVGRFLEAIAPVTTDDTTLVQ